jgi:hypothetical protein
MARRAQAGVPALLKAIRAAGSVAVLGRGRDGRCSLFAGTDGNIARRGERERRGVRRQE